MAILVHHQNHGSDWHQAAAIRAARADGHARTEAAQALQQARFKQKQEAFDPVEFVLNLALGEYGGAWQIVFLMGCFFAFNAIVISSF